MNIETTGINSSAKTSQAKNAKQSRNDSSVKFSDELNGLQTEKEVMQEQEVKKESDKEVSKASDDTEKIENIYEGLNEVVKQFNQLDENSAGEVKKDGNFADNNGMINNDFNVENKDLLPQMNPGMSFNSNGQPFSSFMNEDAQQHSNKGLSANLTDLAEEATVLSTMAENIAIANKNTMLKQADRTVVNDEGIKKVDAKTGVTTENIAKFDSIIMNEADVEVFAQLVNEGSVDIKNLAPQSVEKGVQVSKTLADMLAKSMETSQPVRIDFDNNISVIIRISRDGKLTADFLPSSQVAEAYLKENLPLLRQKFDNENIKYDELNQRERREQAKDQNRKKGRNDE